MREHARVIAALTCMQCRSLAGMSVSLPAVGFRREDRERLNRIALKRDMRMSGSTAQ